ncbi:hypothetical protein [Alkaliphilus transvaalensis]|uniref:hypothetical protein n=1 Tax=Alkaliphilus transvaalensis TaxID=114628 RepID=UPI00047A604A|nr:hypothetical protein [Alkaliphilus transvaalensis]
MGSLTMFKKFAKYTMLGFIMIFILLSFDIIVGFNKHGYEEFIEIIGANLFGSIILSPIGALLIYSFKFAAIPLFKDFIKGSLRHKLIIIIIVISLLMLKLGEYR